MNPTSPKIIPTFTPEQALFWSAVVNEYRLVQQVQGSTYKCWNLSTWSRTYKEAWQTRYIPGTSMHDHIMDVASQFLSSSKQNRITVVDPTDAINPADPDEGAIGDYLSDFMLFVPCERRYTSNDTYSFFLDWVKGHLPEVKTSLIIWHPPTNLPEGFATIMLHIATSKTPCRECTPGFYSPIEDRWYAFFYSGGPANPVTIHSWAEFPFSTAPCVTPTQS